MAYPTAPNITYSYTGFQAGQGGNLFPGTQMDNDLSTLETFGSSVVDFIKLFANSDGTLKVTAFTDTSVLQVVDSATGAVATGTTFIPGDDTIPQQTEGDQYLSATITPRYSTSILEIDALVHIAHTAGSGYLAAALFQDATAGALATGYQTFINAGYTYQVRVRHRMVAGTTSATTFKVRAGGSAAGTTTFNGTGGARLYGGALTSFINIREIKA